MSHIPHVTIKTNVTTLEDAYYVFEKHVKTHPIVNISFMNELVKFPSFYVHDPLQAYGWYVRDVRPTFIVENWNPHMSLRYQTREKERERESSHIDNALTPTDLTCFLAIADTFSNNPSDWRIICDASNTECE